MAARGVKGDIVPTKSLDYLRRDKVIGRVNRNKKSAMTLERLFNSIKS